MAQPVCQRMKVHHRTKWSTELSEIQPSQLMTHADSAVRFLQGGFNYVEIQAGVLACCSAVSPVLSDSQSKTLLIQVSRYCSPFSAGWLNATEIRLPASSITSLIIHIACFIREKKFTMVIHFKRCLNVFFFCVATSCDHLLVAWQPKVKNNLPYNC